MVGARVELGAGISEGAGVEADFGTDPAAQAEALRRVQQAVAPVVVQAQRYCGDVERPAPRFAGRLDRVALVCRQHFAADAPGPLLLPDEIALPLKASRQRQGLG